MHITLIILNLQKSYTTAICIKLNFRHFLLPFNCYLSQARAYIRLKESNSDSPGKPNVCIILDISIMSSLPIKTIVRTFAFPQISRNTLWKPVLEELQLLEFVGGYFAKPDVSTFLKCSDESLCSRVFPIQETSRRCYHRKRKHLEGKRC